MQSALTPPRALVFDWDNTLIDTWPLIHRALEDTFRNYEVTPWTLKETKQRVRRSARETFPQLFGERSSEAIGFYTGRYRHWSARELTALSQAERLLPIWSERGRGPLAVVSNKQGMVLREEAERLGWDRYFHRLIGANDAPEDKPSVLPLRMALEGSGIGLGPEVWFVGDTDIDMACARNAGCTAVFLAESGPPEESPDADLIVDSLSALSSIIEAHHFLNSSQMC
jgi:phosphoglycolate phosphatase